MKGFFDIFGKPRGRNIAVVDISPASVGAAFSTIAGVAPPAIVYSSRVDNESASGATPGALRALDAVAREMSLKGAPALKNATGSGSVEEAYVLVGAPWQRSKLYVHTIEKEKPFIFSEAMLHEAMAEGKKDGSTVSRIASVLNGYETPMPVGKRATRAEIVLLASSIEPEIEPYIKRAVRSFVGSAHLSYVSFGSTAHLVLEGHFPHERDFIALRIGTEATELASIKQNHLVGVETVPVGAGHFTRAAREHGIVSSSVPDAGKGLIDVENNERLSEKLAQVEETWTATMKDAFLKIAAEGALPRVIFLFAEERSLPFFKRLLDSPTLHQLWLSDEPLSVIPVGKRHFAQFMRHIKEDTDDSVLDMLALLSRVSGLSK